MEILLTVFACLAAPKGWGWWTFWICCLLGVIVERKH